MRQDEDLYESSAEAMLRRRRRAKTGRVVIKASELKWQDTRQGRLAYYLIEGITDTAVQDWKIFQHRIHTHSGKHTHQGGLALYIVDGRGSTVVNGQREEWAEGDLCLLPVMDGGVEHQHFNAEPGSSCVWVGFIYTPHQYLTGDQFEQNEDVDVRESAR